MVLNELTPTAMDAAAAAIGDGPVTMVNLIWFRDAVEYPAGFDGARPDPRGAYYEGYAGAFNRIAAELGVTGVELVLRASRTGGLVSAPEDDWDDLVIVRYQSFADFRRIVESEPYHRLASPHRLAGISNWRLIATRAG